MGICIYCKQDSSASQGKPHVVPEAFLKNEVVLPIGAECDQCNGYASKLEQAFIHHNRIWVPIMFLQAPGKDGKVRDRLGFYRKGGQKGSVTLTVKDAWLKKENNHWRAQVPNPPEYDELSFRRCLGHIALNYIAWKFGWEVALESRFDKLRQFVRYGSRREMWPYGQVSYEDAHFRRKLSLGLVENAPGMFVRLESYIDDFYIDVLNEGRLKDWMPAVNKGKEYLYFP